jgi:hypothetical protein
MAGSKSGAAMGVAEGEAGEIEIALTDARLHTRFRRPGASPLFLRPFTFLACDEIFDLIPIARFENLLLGSIGEDFVNRVHHFAVVDSVVNTMTH